MIDGSEVAMKGNRRMDEHLISSDAGGGTIRNVDLVAADGFG